MKIDFVTKTSAFLTPVTGVTTWSIYSLYILHIFQVSRKVVTNGYWLHRGGRINGGGNEIW